MGRTSTSSNFDLETKKRIKELCDLGLSQKEVALRLGISRNSIANYRHFIERKKTKNENKKTSIKVYYLISPRGTTCKVTKVNQFCVENDITSTGFYALVNGKQQICKGWKFLKTEVIQLNDN